MGEPERAPSARSATRIPHPALRALVTTYHGYRYDGGEPGVHHGIPSTSLTAVLSFDRPIDVGWLTDPDSRRPHWAMASGLSMMPAGIYHDGAQHGIQLDLTPLGARRLFGVPAAALHGELVSLDDIIGSIASRLYAAVASARDWPARFAALDDELLRLAAAHEDPAAPGGASLDRAWNRLHATSGGAAVAALADEVGWSRRQLSRRFGAEYGIGPKQAARLIRLGTARPLVVSGRHSLAEVATRCGYADEAHLTREWRELAGAPPTVWLQQEGPFLQDHVGEW